MPVVGTGIMPPSGAVANELEAVTRRAFMPRMIVQIYNSSPFLAALLSSANLASGGVSQVTVPVQGSNYVQTQSIGYGGSFSQPPALQAAQNAEFNLKAFATPIPFYGMESVVQLNHAIIPLVEARMNDAGMSIVDYLTVNAFNNYGQGGTTASPWSPQTPGDTTQDMLGLPAAVDDGTVAPTYGNISRNTNTFWKAYKKAAGAVNPTRALVLQYISGLIKNCGESPTFGIMGMGTWLYLAQDFLGVERYNISPGSSFDRSPDGPRSAFTALMVANVPIYADPYCPEGTLWLWNQNYGGLYIHEQGHFTFTGFESLLPNYQLGYIGAVISIMEMVVVKPKAFGQITGFNAVSI